MKSCCLAFGLILSLAFLKVRQAIANNAKRFLRPGCLRVPSAIIAALVLVASIMPGATVAAQCDSDPAADHLLITEIKAGPVTGEFVEIHNPTGIIIDLSNYYLYNATSVAGNCFYYNIVSGAECGATSGDFSLRFPAGASISPGEYQVIALTGAINYCNTYFESTSCEMPTYEVPPPGADEQTVPNMRGVWDGDYLVFTTYGFLSSSSEELVLFQWDGVSATVKDVDYVIWGTNLDVRTDKTSIAGYQPDTPVGSQSALTGNIQNNVSFQRICFNEGTESITGGNGITGHDETSENFDTWAVAAPTPREPPIITPPQPPVLSYVTNAASNSVSVIDTETNTVVATVPVGRGPFRVAITPNGSRAYVANAGSNSVSVVDTATETVVATIAVGRMPSVLAVRQDGSRVYVVNTGSNSVSVINTATNVVVTTIPVGVWPSDIVILSAGSRAYVSNMGSNSISVIDTATETVVATVLVGRGPTSVAIKR